jgi:hypothetical protein
LEGFSADLGRKCSTFPEGSAIAALISVFAASRPGFVQQPPYWAYPIELRRVTR